MHTAFGEHPPLFVAHGLIDVHVMPSPEYPELHVHFAEPALAAHVAFAEQAAPFVQAPDALQVCGTLLTQRTSLVTHAPHTPPLHTPPAPHAARFGNEVPVSVQVLPVAAHESAPVWQSFVGLHAGFALGLMLALLSSQSVVAQPVFHSAASAPGQTVAHAVVAAQNVSPSWSRQYVALLGAPVHGLHVRSVAQV